MTKLEDEVEAAMGRAMVPIGQRKDIRRRGEDSELIDVLLTGTGGYRFIDEMEAEGYDFRYVDAAVTDAPDGYWKDKVPVAVWTFKETDD